MTDTRRGFLALVGGSLLSGSVLRRASASAPALILPPALVVAPPVASRPLLEAALADGKSQMDVILKCGMRMPKDAFLDWLEHGLGRSLLYSEPDHAARERELEAAERRYGLIAAMRAGAI